MSESVEFYLPIRIYIEDTDAGGIVFYANYLKYFERARTEFIRTLDFELRACMADNINFVVHSLDLKYLRPAKLDEVINVYAKIKAKGRTFMLFEQKVENGLGEILVEGSVKVACVHLDTGKPRALPIELLKRLDSSSQLSNI
ncbi:MAG: tol-pal system-associated acyl-CoA thioesterase [Oleiphilaceae bacterium]|jgi:tol-pal system-associated acyl-CoA thioesterase